MKRALQLLLVLVTFTSLALHAQISSITIEAGSPEDKTLQSISEEKDSGKRTELLKDFVQKFAGNPSAVAYGYSQLAQIAQADGSLQQALAYGDKALEAMPNNLDLLVAQANVALQAKTYAKVVEYAARGGKVVHGASERDRERPSTRQSYEYLEGTAISAISSETDPKQTPADVEAFNDAFPKSRFQESAAQYAMVALQQLNDTPRLVAFGQKALAADPDNLPLLTLMANALAEDPKGAHLNLAVEYARKAIVLAKADAPDADRSRKLAAGLAHSSLGFALMKQEKTVAAITELKTAADLLESDNAAYSTVLYRLGFAYAKLKRYGESREVLTKAVKVEGPFQQPSRELLGKVSAAVKR